MPEKSTGFTLVELLIAFVLISLISLLLFSGLRTGIRAWEGVETAAIANADLRLARDFLLRILSQSHSVTLMLKDEPYLVFSGDSENLEFVAPLSEQVGIPGLYILRIGIVKREQQNLLVMTRWLLNSDVLMGKDDVPEWQPLKAEGHGTVMTDDQDLAAGVYGTSILLEGVEEFNIAYFGPPPGEELAVTSDVREDWQSTWRERTLPPKAIRIRLFSSNRQWPDLIIRPGGSDQTNKAVIQQPGRRTPAAKK